MNRNFNHLLVTGGAGFIGANFIDFMLKKYPAVKICSLDKVTYAASSVAMKDLKSKYKNDRYTFIKGDICDEQCINSVITTYPIDAIVHFAAESHVDRSIEKPYPFVETNVIGTYMLLEAARKTGCHFHHISTDEVYGALQKKDPPFSESSPYKPNSPYSASKAASDHFVRAYGNTYQLSYTLSNCSNNYGRYQNAEKFIPTIIRSCLNRTPIPIYGNGKNIRDWIHVDDHCSAIEIILRNGKKGESYNIGSHSEINNIQLSKIICQVIAGKLKINPQAMFQLIHFVPDRLGHDFRYAINTEKISTLGWKPEIKLEQGIQETIEWFVDVLN